MNMHYFGYHKILSIYHFFSRTNSRTIFRTCISERRVFWATILLKYHGQNRLFKKKNRCYFPYFSFPRRQGGIFLEFITQKDASLRSFSPFYMQFSSLLHSLRQEFITKKHAFLRPFSPILCNFPFSFSPTADPPRIFLEFIIQKVVL